MRIPTALLLCGGLLLSACGNERSDLLGDGRSGNYKNLAPGTDIVPPENDKPCVEGNQQGETCRRVILETAPASTP